METPASPEHPPRGFHWLGDTEGILGGLRAAPAGDQQPGAGSLRPAARGTQAKFSSPLLGTGWAPLASQRLGFQGGEGTDGSLASPGSGYPELVSVDNWDNWDGRRDGGDPAQPSLGGAEQEMPRCQELAARKPGLFHGASGVSFVHGDGTGGVARAGGCCRELWVGFLLVPCLSFPSWERGQRFRAHGEVPCASSGGFADKGKARPPFPPRPRAGSGGAKIPKEGAEGGQQ